MNDEGKCVPEAKPMRKKKVYWKKRIVGRGSHEQDSGNLICRPPTPLPIVIEGDEDITVSNKFFQQCPLNSASGAQVPSSPAEVIDYSSRQGCQPETSLPFAAERTCRRSSLAATSGQYPDSLPKTVPNRRSSEIFTRRGKWPPWEAFWGAQFETGTGANDNAETSLSPSSLEADSRQDPVPESSKARTLTEPSDSPKAKDTDEKQDFSGEDDSLIPLGACAALLEPDSNTWKKRRSRMQSRGILCEPKKDVGTKVRLRHVRAMSVPSIAASVSESSITFHSKSALHTEQQTQPKDLSLRQKTSMVKQEVDYNESPTGNRKEEVERQERGVTQRRLSLQVSSMNQAVSRLDDRMNKLLGTPDEDGPIIDRLVSEKIGLILTRLRMAPVLEDGE